MHFLRRGKTELPAPKTKISYHRSYRRLVMDDDFVLTAGISFVILILTLWLGGMWASRFTYEVSLLLQRFLGSSIGETHIFTVGFRGESSLYMLNFEIALPSLYLSGGTAIVCFLIFMFFDVLRLPRPLTVLIKIMALLIFFFALLFLYFPSHFSYNDVFMEEFFIQVSAIVWFAMPGIFWLATLPLPLSLLRKIFFLLLFEVCLTCLFVLKYALFLVVCAYGTYLVVPVVIFFLCSLFDVVYMICLFSFMLNFTSKRIARDTTVWQWA